MPELKAIENHELTNEVFIFCTLKLFHLEFRNTLPNFSNVVLNLLFRSNNKRRYTK
jgi:hypothetical protein